MNDVADHPLIKRDYPVLSEVLCGLSHATAAVIEEESRNLESARPHREVSRAMILPLASSLPEQEPLRKIFLSAPAVSRVLSRDV